LDQPPAIALEDKKIRSARRIGAPSPTTAPASPLRSKG
jgi:hypothetical protein